MEPLNQNWGALPGTVLESGPGPIEVGFKRLGPELELLKQQEKAKIDATKEKAAKAAEAMKLPDYTPVGIPHQGVYANMHNQFMKEQAELERLHQQNPLDSRYDLSNPFSEAGMKRQASIRQQQDYAAASTEKQKAWYDFLSKFDSAKDNPLDMKRMKEWYERSPDITNDGEVAIDPMPVLIGNFDKSQFYADVAAKMKPDVKSSSGPSGKGYFFTSDVTRLTPEDIRKEANVVADEYGSNVLFAVLTEEMNNAKESNPKEYERVAADAKKAGVTWQQQKAYEDMIPLAYEQQKKTSSADQTYNNMMGSGWGTEDAEADRLVRWMEGVSNNDPEVITELFGEITPVAGGQAPITLDGNSGFAKALQGVIVANKMDDGKPIPERVESITVHNGTVSVKTRSEDGSAGRVLKYKQEDFLSDFTEQLADNNPKIKRGRLYQVAQDRGRIKESGYIESGKKPGLADEILAPSSKKGMMD